jgi:divalent metal cation (Fe/Co/Zn/Cd) transporter
MLLTIMIAVLVLISGWAFLIFAGSAHGAGIFLISRTADRLIILALYASGFGLLLWHHHPATLMLGLAVAIHFCGVYAASFKAGTRAAERTGHAVLPATSLPQGVEVGEA